MNNGKLPRIGKLEAARRQIEFAISAHFSNGDPFAIHTVTTAAFGILRALAEKRGSVKAHQAISDRIRPGKEGEFWRYINRASNFLKHADRDPDAMLEDVSAEINDSAIFFAIVYYADLSPSPISPTMELAKDDLAPSPTTGRVIQQQSTGGRRYRGARGIRPPRNCDPRPVDDSYYYGAYCRKVQAMVVAIEAAGATLGDTFPLLKISDRLRCERCSSRQTVITFLAPDQRTENLV